MTSTPISKNVRHSVSGGCTRALLNSVITLGLLNLTACGGGGGGGGGGPSGGVALSINTLNFATSDPAFTPVSQNFSATITSNVSGTLYLRIETTGPAVAGITDILITGDDTGQATVVPAPSAALGPGTYTSTVTVTACTSGPACTSDVIGSDSLTVNYTVTGVATGSAGLDYSVNLTPVPADYTRTLQIRAYPSYTATDDVDWLMVAPGAGAAAGVAQLDVALAQSAVDAFDSGTYTATISLTAPGGNTVQVPVSLTIAKPQLDQVTPYVAEANTSGEVVLRGLFLDQLPGNAIDLSTSPMGTGIAPTSVTPISSTEIRVTHPALAAATYLVRMRDTLGAIIDRSRARLVVVERPDFAQRALAYPADARLRRVDDLVYDAERKALLLVVAYGANPATENDLMRFAYDTDWSDATVLPFPNLDSLALAADGRDLVVASSPVVGVSNRATLSLLSPTTLVERAFLQSNALDSYFPMLAVLSTNDVLAPEGSRTSTGGGRTLYRYSVKTQSLTTMSGQPPNLFGGLTEGTVVVSADGMRAVAASNAGSSGDQRIWEYSASAATNQMARAPVNFDVTRLRIDRDGDTLVVRGSDFFGGAFDFVRVYDRNWTIRGSLPQSAFDIVLAPDGSRAYTYDADGLVHIYDLTAATVMGMFPEIGALTLIGSPGTSVPSLTRLAITPDGRKLFLAGSDQVVIQPLP